MRFLDDVDKVTSGRQGAISGDRWLVSNYDPGKLPCLVPYLDFEDPRVVSELVGILGDVRERAVMDKVLRMRDESGDAVSMACLGYLTAIREDDEAIPGLLDALNHTRGSEFSRAARRLAGIARAEDLREVRKVYGQVGGTMRDETRVILERIIARNPVLEARRDLILSVPVYPDEDAFERFLDTSIEYLDVRYRGNVHPREEIGEQTFNNVARALRRMRTRLYNESDNLHLYGPDKEDRFQELSALMRWANGDLSGKRVRPADGKRSRVCPRCGGMLVCYKGIWMCPDCGGDLRPAVHYISGP